jgi:glycine hydroxymethyltransferase
MHLKNLPSQDKKIYDLILKEAQRQSDGIELIASENHVSASVMETMGSILSNKYSEGYPGKRYYAGNQVIDEMEELAISRVKKLFDAEHVNIQPLSGSPANMAVYFALLKPGDKVMGFSLDQGGHLSHGHPLNFSGKLYKIIPYFVDKKTEQVDMDKVEKIALREKPKMIIAGFSAYSRDFNWKRFAKIAKKINAITFADIAHIAGLIAGKQLENPVPIFDVVTTTTHKTLRGPRGAIIMCKHKFAKDIDRAVFPGLQGGPHDHINAAKAVAFGEALKPSFKSYSKQVVKNAKVLAKTLAEGNIRIISGGTDNHLMLCDMSSIGLTGKITERALDMAGISANKNMIPYDKRKPMDPSGIRLGTPAITTRGMKEREMKQIGAWIIEACTNYQDNKKLIKIRKKVKKMCAKFPVPGIKQN